MKEASRIQKPRTPPLLTSDSPIHGLKYKSRDLTGPQTCEHRTLQQETVIDVWFSTDDHVNKMSPKSGLSPSPHSKDQRSADWTWQPTQLSHHLANPPVFRPSPASVTAREYCPARERESESLIKTFLLVVNFQQVKYFVRRTPLHDAHSFSLVLVNAKKFLVSG